MDRHYRERRRVALLALAPVLLLSGWLLATTPDSAASLALVIVAVVLSLVIADWLHHSHLERYVRPIAALTHRIRTGKTLHDYRTTPDLQPLVYVLAEAEATDPCESSSSVQRDVAQDTLISETQANLNQQLWLALRSIEAETAPGIHDVRNLVRAMLMLDDNWRLATTEQPCHLHQLVDEVLAAARFAHRRKITPVYREFTDVVLTGDRLPVQRQLLRLISDTPTDFRLLEVSLAGNQLACRPLDTANESSVYVVSLPRSVTCSERQTLAGLKVEVMTDTGRDKHVLEQRLRSLGGLIATSVTRDIGIVMSEDPWLLKQAQKFDHPVVLYTNQVLANRPACRCGDIVMHDELLDCLKQIHPAAITDGPSAPVFDAELSLRLANHLPDVADELLATLMQTLTSEADAICQQVTSGEYEAALQLAHRLNGALGYCGVPRLQHALSQLQRQLRAGSDGGITVSQAVFGTEVQRLTDWYDPKANYFATSLLPRRG